MEIQFPSQPVILAFLLVLSTLTLFKLFKSKISTANLPPGPWKLPLIGNILNLVGDVPHRALHQLALKYGPLMHVQLGELSVVVVSSPDAAKRLLKTHDLNFASRPSLLAIEIMSYKCTNIAFSPYGEYWRQLRKICAMELLSAMRVQSFRSLREEVFSDLVRWIASTEGLPFDLTEKIFSSTYHVVARAAFGKNTEERKRLLPILQEGAVYSAGFNIADVYPSIKLFRKMSAVGRRLIVLHHEADKIFDGIISDHKVGKCTDGEDKQDDLVDVLLKYQEDGLELPLTNNNIKAVILDVLTGGTETSSTTMDWAMAEMLKNPEVLAKAQQEVRRVFDSQGCVDESRIHELKYLKCVVKETLRMHPPLPLSVPRKCSETCEVNGYQIPANTKIIFNLWAINRDSNNWKEAHSFQPERFLVAHQVDFRGNHFEFIPFGAGRRVCPGISFGIANLELPLAMLLYHFDWKLGGGAEPQEMEMKEGFGITATRLKHLWVVPVIKRPLPNE